MRVKLHEARLRAIIREELAKTIVEASSVGDVIAAADKFAEKVAGLDKQSAVKFITKSLGPLADEFVAALDANGISELTQDVQKKLTSALRDKMSDSAEANVTEAGMSGLDNDPGTGWVDTSNDLGNFIETATSGAALVLTLPLMLVSLIAKKLGKVAKKSTLLTTDDITYMHAVINRAMHPENEKYKAFATQHRPEIDALYKKFSGIKGKALQKQHREIVNDFVSSYKALTGA